MYIAIKYDTVHISDYSLVGLCLRLVTIKINDKGIISVNGKDNIACYNMNEWNKDEAIRDFCLTTFLKIASAFGIEIFKAEKLSK